MTKQNKHPKSPITIGFISAAEQWGREHTKLLHTTNSVSKDATKEIEEHEENGPDPSQYSLKERAESQPSIDHR